MNDVLIQRILAHVMAGASVLPFEPASEEAVQKAERDLGFPIPTFLKACYLQVGNGGFGPGYGVIGVEGGYASDHGDLVETHAVLKCGTKSRRLKWPDRVLPFCEWGCNIFSCTDSDDVGNPVFTCDQGHLSPETYTLDGFFELWLDGVNILSYKRDAGAKVEIINPFTGKPTTVSKRGTKRAR
jgi:hypothetical protein